MSNNRETQGRLNWVNLIFLVATFVLAVGLVPWYLWHFGMSWELALLFVLSCVATSFSITAGYHRLFAHRAYRARRWVEWMFVFWGAGAFQGSVLQWGSDHRHHHRFIDSDQDPYNINKGFWWAHIGWLFFFDPPEKQGQYAPDLSKDRLLQWQHRHYVPLAIFVGFIIPILLGWSVGAPLGGFIILGLGRLVFTQHCTFFINSLCHYLGRRPYNASISARDSFVMALLTYGEGYHNFHHQFQFDYRNGVRWYQWDPTKWTIRLMSWIGLADKLKRVHPFDILKARMQNDENKLLTLGISAESLAHLKARVEHAQARVRQIHEEYRRLKASMQESSRAQLDQLKAELKLARQEFRLAIRQWTKNFELLAVR